MLSIKLYDFIIFGANGDLTKRKLFPSLYRLEKEDKLSKNTRIVGIGRSNWDSNTYKKIIKIHLKLFLNEKIDKNIWKILKKKIIYCSMDINQIHEFQKLKKIIKNKNKLIIYYFAISSIFFKKICKGLSKNKLNFHNSRIILEKPIGNSLNNFNKINNDIKKYFSEKQIFRIDHYLGKDTILNIFSLKFANPLFMNIWNNKFIDHIQITIAENIGIEKRWDYFDNTGQIRDMVQNHILQIISIIAMSSPISLNANHISLEKIKILNKLKKINANNIKKYIVLGQYKKGFHNNKILNSYLDESNLNQSSNTETFVSMKIYIDNKNWNGVPFYIRTGKRLPKKCSKIIIFLKNKYKNLFSNEISKNFLNNFLTIRIEPNEGISINLVNKIPELSSNYTLKSNQLHFNYKNFFKNSIISDAYDKLLLEGIKGIKNLFVHENEIISSWKWIDPIIMATKNIPSLIKKYPAGTWGPDLSEIMMEKDNKKWDND